VVPPLQAELATLAATWRGWIGGHVLPFWEAHGRGTETALFLERLHLDGTPDVAAPLRLRTQARQVYVYAHAYLMGLAPTGLDVARPTLLELYRRAWAPDGRPGWIHVLDAKGAPLDRRRDAYDHAFVLLMLAYYLRASGEAFVRPWIEATIAAIDTLFAAPHGGYAETDTGGLPRRQNPHMHLFEAFLALYEASGEPRFLARAGALFGLFRTRFMDDDAGIVREFFTVDWRRLPDGTSDRIEPGHLVEWVWLLRRYARHTGTPVDGLCATLLTSARRLGQPPAAAGCLVDVTDLTGVTLEDSRRLWPQTELIKALVAEARARHEPALVREAAALSDTLFRTYLAATPPGTWRDRFTVAGTLAVDHIPASTLYHLFGVLAELEHS
jgi:mannose-6-phosphate isomerase